MAVVIVFKQGETVRVADAGTVEKAEIPITGIGGAGNQREPAVECKNAAGTAVGAFRLKDIAGCFTETVHRRVWFSLQLLEDGHK